MRLPYLALLVCALLLAPAISSPAEPPCGDGLVVVVESEDHELLGALATKPSRLVQALFKDQASLDSALVYIDANDLTARLSAAPWNGKELPYVGNNVNGIIAREGSVAKSELERVLAPEGTARTFSGKAMLTKGREAGADEWTHNLYNAGGMNSSRDTLVGPPRHLKWKAGPEFTRSHENISSVSAMVSEGGRVYAIMDVGSKASIYLPSKWLLTARDAYSGVLLWQKELPSWHARLFPLKNDGASLQVTRRLVAADGHVYVTLGLDAPVSKIDGATGKIKAVYNDTRHAEELLYSAGKLITVCADDTSVQEYKGALPQNHTTPIKELVPRVSAPRSLVIIDTASDTLISTAAHGEITSLTLAADEQVAAFYVDQSLVVVSLADGKERWRKEPTSGRKTKAKATRGLHANPVIIIHDNVIYTADTRTIRAYAAPDGEQLWEVATNMGAYKVQPSLVIHDNLIWNTHTGGEPYRPGYRLEAGGANRAFFGYDLKTGEQKRELPLYPDGGYGVMHHRCHPPRAVEKHIITSFPGIEFIDSTSGDMTHASWVRGACLYGFMPANGLLYMPPHPCACYPQGKLSGYMGIAPASRGSDVTPATTRLTEGPAYGEVISHQSPVISGEGADAVGQPLITDHRSLITDNLSPITDDWPTYRGGMDRAGVYDGNVSESPKPKWEVKLGGKLTQPVVSGGMLFTVARDKRRLHALDAQSGKLLWSKNLAAKVDSPPTCYKGMLIFGSHDGYVYSLRASDGELVWRFLAAIADRRLVDYGQVTSLWPVSGSVLIHNDELWFAAGRDAFLDGGILVYRLNPITGEQLSVKTVCHTDEKGSQPETGKALFPSQTATDAPVVSRLDMQGAKADVLLSNGTKVFMRHTAFDSSGNEIAQDTAHLYAPYGFLDESWFRRSYWVYGHRYMGGAQGWAQIGNTGPTGRILSIGTDNVYAYGRTKYPPSPGNNAQMYRAGEYEVFYARGKRQSEAERAMTGMHRKSPGKEMTWSTEGDIQTRGLVVTNGERLMIAAGAKGNWVTSESAFNGEEGSALRIMSTTDGKTLAELPISAPPVHDGLIAADGRLYLALKSGCVVCFE